MTGVTVHAPTIPRCSQSLRVLHSRPMDVGLLLRRVIEGDQRAWDELVGRFGGLVWSIARGYRLGALTDDVVQTVWLRLAENCDRIRDPERLAAWLATTTTRNEALRVSKKQARTLSVGDVPERSDNTVSSLEELVTDNDTLGLVMQAFGKLSPADQQFLRLLCTVPPLDYATIAEMIGRPIGSIGPSRERTLAKLRKLLSPGLDDPIATPPSKGDGGMNKPPNGAAFNGQDERFAVMSDDELAGLVAQALASNDPVPDHVLEAPAPPSHGAPSRPSWPSWRSPRWCSTRPANSPGCAPRTPTVRSRSGRRASRSK